MHANLSPPTAADSAYLSNSGPPAGLPIEQKPKASSVRTLPASLIAFFLFAQLFDYHALRLATFTPDKIFFVIILLLFGYAALSGRLRGIRWSGTEVCMALFALLCIASYCVNNPDAGLDHYKWLTTLLNFIGFPFAVYLFAKKTRYTAAKTLWLLWAIVGIGVYLALTASFEHFGIDSLVFPKYILDPHVGIQFGRSRGPMVGSNPMGEWLVVVFLATCLVLPFARTLGKVLLYGLMLLATMGIYFTLTRGAWISFAAVVILTAAFGGKFGMQSRLIAILVLVAFFAGFGSKFSYGKQTLFSKRLNTIDYRLSNNKTTFNMGMAHPFTGVGYGSFNSSWEKYFGNKERELTNDLTDGNHNTFLGLFADLGVPGVGLYVALLGYLLREGLRVRRALEPSAQFERNLALCSICLLIVAMIEAMSGDLRFNPTLNTLTFLFLGMTASMKYSSFIKKPARRNAQPQGGFQETKILPHVSAAGWNV